MRSTSPPRRGRGKRRPAPTSTHGQMGEVGCRSLSENLLSHILPSFRRGRRPAATSPGDAAGRWVVRSLRACRTRAHRRRSEGGVPGRGASGARRGAPPGCRPFPDPLRGLRGRAQRRVPGGLARGLRGCGAPAPRSLARALSRAGLPHRRRPHDRHRQPLDARPLRRRPLPAQPDQLPPRRHAAARLPARAAPARRPAAEHRLRRHPGLRGHRDELRDQRGRHLLRGCARHPALGPGHAGGGPHPDPARSHHGLGLHPPSSSLRYASRGRGTATGASA